LVDNPVGDGRALRLLAAVRQCRALQESIQRALTAPPEQFDRVAYLALCADYEAKCGAGESDPRRLSMEELLGPAPWDEVEEGAAA
jgi:hypothetical protein